ncbi:proteoglycan 4-like [Schistocerca nitens]|uniref:proteoglycan 4-like n=1 Tax=Schistocerca nitens TaxID=7011 RepID=UPI002119A0B5|nr:proteoglycan 4-like [Schistocerca nitens]
MKIRIESYKPRIGPRQCRRCQRFDHTANYCTLPTRCLICAGLHEAKDCTKPRSDSSVCANCNGAHPANYKGCEVYQSKLKPFLPTARTEQHTRPPKRAGQHQNAVQRQEAPETTGTQEARQITTQTPQPESSRTQQQLDKETTRTYASAVSPKQMTPVHTQVKGRDDTRIPIQGPLKPPPTPKPREQIPVPKPREPGHSPISTEAERMPTTTVPTQLEATHIQESYPAETTTVPNQPTAPETKQPTTPETEQPAPPQNTETGPTPFQTEPGADIGEILNTLKLFDKQRLLNTVKLTAQKLRKTNDKATKALILMEAVFTIME